MFLNLTPESIRQNFSSQGYIADDTIISTVFNALAINSPILVDGPAGVGKTELAKTIARMLSANMIRLQCYSGIGVNEVLYEMDASKIQSYTTMLDQHVKNIVHGKTWEEAVKTIETKKFFSSEDFLIKRPVLQAIDPDDNRFQLLLIDEIDKADEKIEAMLLEVLSDYSVSVPELGRTYHARPDMKPFVILTSNNVRELGEPLRRRCSYLYIDYPSIEVEQRIIHMKSQVPFDYAYDAACLMKDIRENVSMKKLPSNSESINFFHVMYHCYGLQKIDKSVYGNVLAQGVSLLAKYQSDNEALTKYFLK